MFFEIVFCFFTVFGIVQLLALIWDMIFAKMPKDCTIVINVNDDTDFKLLSTELKKQNAKLIFVYDEINEKRLEILEKKFNFASFVTRDKLTDEILRII